MARQKNEGIRGMRLQQEGAILRDLTQGNFGPRSGPSEALVSAELSLFIGPVLMREGVEDRLQINHLLNNYLLSLHLNH